MKYLGIDHGTKRIGIALSDDSGKIAFPARIIASGKKAFKEIEMLCRKEKVGQVVIGLPKGADRRETDQTGKVRAFAKVLKQKIALPVAFQDELLTTRIARSLPFAKKEVDASSAALTLQAYLDKKLH
jgi:putative Holliday junction resolvase